MNNIYLQGLVNDFSKLEEVDAILLAGSMTTGHQDKNSDYDIYIYINKEILIEKRKEILERYYSYIELNNQFWETEDHGILNDGTPIELIYRSFDWLEPAVDSVVFGHNAGNSYTTCFWSNIKNSQILFDRKGKAKELITKYDIEFPEELRRNIIKRNYKLLKTVSPSYYNQIKKAAKRDDYLSINHRVSEMFASYFDIIYAFNRIQHPGEKKLLHICKKTCNKLPLNFENNINSVLKNICQSDKIVDEVDTLLKNLKLMLEEENLI